MAGRLAQSCCRGLCSVVHVLIQAMAKNEGSQATEEQARDTTSNELFSSLKSGFQNCIVTHPVGN